MRGRMDRTKDCMNLTGLRLIRLIFRRLGSMWHRSRGEITPFNVIFFVLLFSFFVLPIPCSSADPQSKTPITIGVLASLSGEWASLGDMTRKGLTLAEEEINATEPLVLGGPIKLSFQDTDEAVSASKVISSYR